MRKNSLKNLLGLIVFSVSLQAIANETIKVQVKTKEASAAALGFTVEGKNRVPEENLIPARDL